MATLSLAALQALAAQESSDPILALVTVTHADLPGGPVRLAMTTTNITSNGDLFLSAMMDVVLMSTEADQVASASIQFDNVDQVILDTLDELGSPPTVKIEYVLASALNDVIASNENLRMTLTETNLNAFRARLDGPDFLNQLVPGVLMDRVNTPALFP